MVLEVVDLNTYCTCWKETETTVRVWIVQVQTSRNNRTTWFIGCKRQYVNQFRSRLILRSIHLEWILK